jgi:hypothetical protein
MKVSARARDFPIALAIMQCCAAGATALCVALGPSLLGNAHAADDAAWHSLKGLVSAAYFSDACRHEAELFGILGSADPRFLIAAFGRRMATGTLDARAEVRAGSVEVESGSAGCSLPAVGFINLLRLNGIAVELALVSTQLAGAPSEPAALDELERVLVYVPVLDRYFDPAATDLSENAALDRITKGNAIRVHLIGPAPFTDPASATCGDVCMSVYAPHHDPYAVRVVTEAIHAP